MNFLLRVFFFFDCIVLDVFYFSGVLVQCTFDMLVNDLLLRSVVVLPLHSYMNLVVRQKDAERERIWNDGG